MLKKIKSISWKRFKWVLFSLPIIVFFQNCGGGFTLTDEINAGAGSLAAGSGAPSSPNEAPEILIISPKSGSYLLPPFTIKGECQNGVEVYYTGDAGQSTQSTSCANGSFEIPVVADLEDNSYSMQIIQMNASGKKDVELFDFMVDTVGPAMSISSPSAGMSFTASKSASIAGNCETGTDVQIAGNALSSLGTAPCVNSSFSLVAALTNEPGAKLIEVAQSDKAGNKTVLNVTVQIAPASATTPVLTILNPLDNTVTSSASVQFSGTCVTGLDVKITGSIANSGVTTPCLNSAFSISATLSAGDGAKNLMASQTNAIGETGSASRALTLDTIVPILAFTSPAAGTKAETGLTIQGSCESGLKVNVSGTGVASAMVVACTNSLFSANISFSANVGSKVVQISQTDYAGNVGTASRTFERIAAPAIDGAQLYTSTCAKCHGQLANSQVGGSSVSQITSALKNEGAMRSIVLTPAQIEAISAALK